MGKNRFLALSILLALTGANASASDSSKATHPVTSHLQKLRIYNMQNGAINLAKTDDQKDVGSNNNSENNMRTQ